MKNARRKLEVPMPPVVLCKIQIKSRGETHRSIGKRKTKYACIVDADESMRIRLEGVPQRYHEDHITAKGVHSLNHYNLVHKFIPVPQAMKIPDAKAAVEKNGKNWRKSRHGSGRKSDDSGSYTVFTEQGSSASQMTAAEVVDIISRQPGCSGQAADAVSANTQVRMEDAPTFFFLKKKIQNHNVQISGYVHQNTNGPIYVWSSMEDPVVPLERNLYGHPFAGQMWERQFEKVLLEHGWEKVPNWECLVVN